MSDASLPPKILCVDDESSILHSLERLLRHNFRVLTASSPKLALETLSQHPDCAVVMSDFRMPEMTGIELLKQIRRLYPQTSRAILSGQIDLQQVAEALNANDIHKFFLKPWENEYLTVQMMEAVQINRTLRDKAHFEMLSITDPVTQLTNHRHFQAELRRQVELARTTPNRLALILFDVDNFKGFNDRFGHPEGDRLLHSLASQLKDLTGKRGTVSRYGGEEFTVIMPLECATYEEAQQEAFGLAESIRTHFERTPFSGLTSSLSYITLSAGIACFPDNGLEANLLIDGADRALYQAKRQGRNQIVTAPKK